MKAMILAAGLGTRLKPITDKIPKALVEVNGVPMLERVILNLKSRGFNRIVVNVHHFADQIKDFLYSRDYVIDIKISDETDKLLDTGGGIIRAYNLLFNDDASPVLIHNVDILSNADFQKLMNTNKGKGNADTLLVSDRESSRKLIFDREMKLLGWHNLKDNAYRWVGPQENREKELAFSGIYVMTREGVDEMRRIMGEGKYSVMDYFLNPEREIPIFGYEQKGLQLIDIGKPATLSQAREIFKD